MGHRTRLWGASSWREYTHHTKRAPWGSMRRQADPPTTSQPHPHTPCHVKRQLNVAVGKLVIDLPLDFSLAVYWRKRQREAVARSKARWGWGGRGREGRGGGGGRGAGGHVCPRRWDRLRLPLPTPVRVTLGGVPVFRSAAPNWSPSTLWMNTSMCRPGFTVAALEAISCSRSTAVL